MNRELRRLLIDVVLLDGEQEPAPSLGDMARRAKRLLDHQVASRKRRLAKSLPRRRAAAAKDTAETGARRALREACLTRAGGRCEACGADGLVLELDHFFGRARSELVETCWMLCGTCHHDKTNSRPGRRYWLLRFQRHATRHACARGLQLVQAQLVLEEARRA